MSATVVQKEPLLFLCHRIPFPPNKGDKIRSFNILKKLSEHFDIHLGCFIDDPFDEQFVTQLNPYCRSVFHLNQNKNIAKIKGLKAFVTGQAITLPYYYDQKMQHWVDNTIAEQQIGKIFVYSSSMAQYCDGDDYADLMRIIDFVDVDSDKWRQYAEKKTGPARWVYQREFRKLAAFEDKICQQFDHSLFVSPDEAALFRDRQPVAERGKVHGLLNGVDIKFFDPDADFASETLVPDGAFISFTGAMDYWANVDAVVWFADKVWPAIIKNYPEVKFVIAGGNPSAEVLALAGRHGIIVTGRVTDIRPFIAQALCVVAPIRIARGIQNKVLEAMALNRPTVVTSMAMEGINADMVKGVDVVDEPLAYAKACEVYLSNVGASVIPESRAWIINNFTWQQTLQAINQYFIKG